MKKGEVHHSFKPKENPIVHAGITCVSCGKAGRLKTTETRKQDNAIRRRRKCLKCNAVFYTVETVEASHA